MRDWIDNQYQNLFLYVPFLMAFGAALYFSFSYEPTIPYASLILVVLSVLIFVRRIPILIRAVLLFVFGFFYAYVFTGLVNTPLLHRGIHDLDVHGTVHSVDYASGRARIYLTLNASDIGISDSGTAMVRLSLPDDTLAPASGDYIHARIGVFRPAPAHAPETFDYARWAYFNGLTATGYAADIRVVRHGNASLTERLRQYLHNKSDSFLVDSLVLGYKGAISSDVSPTWTASGVGHVWSISGFHMTLVGGWIFMIFFSVFRCIPYITRRVPARIPAIICGWVGLLMYLFLSGLDVATIRAFIMTSLVFAAFIFGRSMITLRNIAIAFILIFLINPHYVMQAGFHLSFAAVFGLIWLYSVVRPTMPRNKFIRIIYACILTSVVATIFTAPFVAMHFGSIPVYGLIGNLVLLPVFSFAIMPLVLIGVITSVFNFVYPIELAHYVYDFALTIATYISDLPYASVSVPHISNVSIMCFIFSFMSLILIRPIRIRVNYILFCIFCVVGILVVYMSPRPIFYSTYDNELVGFIDDNARLEFNKSRASRHYFAFDTWKQMNGENTNTPNPRRKHDAGVYRYGNIVYIQKFVPLMKNIHSLCADSTVKYIVSYFDINSDKCGHKILRGGFVIYPNGRVKYTSTHRRWHQ